MFDAAKQRSSNRRQGTLAISVVITAHNEGSELLRTVRSVRRYTDALHEIIVVDDGSTDESCLALNAVGVKLIRHERRTGVASSRDEATQVATGNVLVYLDGHQRVSRSCLDRLAQVALDHRAVVSVDVCGFGFLPRRAYGATFRLCPANGFFSAKWSHSRPALEVSRTNSLKAPAYAIAASVYKDIHWISALRGWGGSEAAISLKAFFTGVDILHLRGPLARHRFRRRFPYTTTWDEVWRNQALIARVCFDDCTWYDYWLPEVFDKHLSEQARADLECEEVAAEHERFLERKVRSDRDFWNELLCQSEPLCMKP